MINDKIAINLWCFFIFQSHHRMKIALYGSKDFVFHCGIAEAVLRRNGCCQGKSLLIILCISRTAKNLIRRMIQIDAEMCFRWLIPG